MHILFFLCKAESCFLKGKRIGSKAGREVQVPNLWVRVHKDFNGDSVLNTLLLSSCHNGQQKPLLQT